MEFWPGDLVSNKYLISIPRVGLEFDQNSFGLVYDVDERDKKGIAVLMFDGFLLREEVELELKPLSLKRICNLGEVHLVFFESYELKMVEKDWKIPC